ncbi:hypothetical protein [Paracoccus saliphilus]|uniref:Uncharacterized protein n=1 Tax=Paracoccus saliphilus TaxID=405559 RepID=A0AA45W2B6_9RHOB|nr:hypothetical protein [Paracoccus saliphilus]WCR01909.1 hypothetical protein JHX88_13410 [Paracoccus saliphilus]SIS65051.1 hypothetical protein SAMN05421772_102274 [Paracoccus saliphilus]
MSKQLIHKINDVGDILDQMDSMEYLLSSAALENETENRGIAYGLNHLSDLLRKAQSGLDALKADLKLRCEEGGEAC